VVILIEIPMSNPNIGEEETRAVYEVVKSGSPNSDVEGDAWIYIFIKRKSYLIVTYKAGKHGFKTCR